MERLFLIWKYKINRLFMCRHDRAMYDTYIFGKGSYYEYPKEWYGIGLAQLYLMDLEKQYRSAREGKHDNN